MTVCSDLVAVCSGLQRFGGSHSCLQLFIGSNRRIQRPFFAKSPISEPEPRSSASVGTSGGLSRYTLACPVPDKGVSGTEYPFCTPEACFEHGGLLKTRRVHQEAFLSTARIFRTGGGLLRYGMHPDMLNCSRCELLSYFLSYPFPHNLGNGRHFRQLYDKIPILAIFNISPAR